MIAQSVLTFAAAAATLLALADGQTFQRLGGCPTLGCVFPPDQVDFLAGQYFDIRLEVHAPVNGTEATGNPIPDPNFTFTIAKAGGASQNAAAFFGVPEPPLERWSFSWYEDLFARDAKRPSLVNVTAKAYRRLALHESGTYTATLTYNNGQKTVAEWLVRDLQTVRRTKNVLMFIGDGMTTNMITAARLIAHKMVNGRYQTRMQMDEFPVVGHQMTHSLDSFITDSANSATALYSGHKSTVNALGCYKDSSANKFDDPKVESIAELFHRIIGGGVGIVSTAFIADATPGALTAHTPDRGQYGAVIDSFLNGIHNYSWTDWHGPDVLFGGGAEQFYNKSAAGVATPETYQGLNYYNAFRAQGYNVVLNKTSMLQTPNDQRALGIFTVSNMDVWLDRNVYTQNLVGNKNAPDGQGGSAIDQPGLKDMTLKAIDILSQRNPQKGWFIMSEAASVDKQMHRLDYDRALGDLLELDDTVKASIAKLKQLGSFEETLILVTADHGHGFDVMGSVDTKYLVAQTTDRTKREAIGTYQNSGQSQYTNPNSEKGPTHNATSPPDTSPNVNGSYFPANWDPRYTLFSGLGADPDRRENYEVHKNGARTPAVNITGFPVDDYFVNYKDAVTGFIVNGTLPVEAAQGVHSLTDVPVYAMGPCQEYFTGSYNSIDIFFGIANCFGLSSIAAPNAPKSNATTSSVIASKASSASGSASKASSVSSASGSASKASSASGSASKASSASSSASKASSASSALSSASKASSASAGSSSATKASSASSASKASSASSPFGSASSASGSASKASSASSASGSASLASAASGSASKASSASGSASKASSASGSASKASSASGSAPKASSASGSASSTPGPAASASGSAPKPSSIPGSTSSASATIGSATGAAASETLTSSAFAYSSVAGNNNNNNNGYGWSGYDSWNNDYQSKGADDKNNNNKMGHGWSGDDDRNNDYQLKGAEWGPPVV